MASRCRACIDIGPSHQKVVAIRVARTHTAIDGTVGDACHIINTSLGAVYKTLVFWSVDNGRPWRV